MTRTHLEILTIIVIIATAIGLTIIGLILIAGIPSYYLAVLVGLMLWTVVLTMAYTIPALKIIGLIVSILVGGVTVGWVVRRFLTAQGCLIATTAGIVGGTLFAALMIALNIIAVIVL